MDDTHPNGTIGAAAEDGAEVEEEEDVDEEDEEALGEEEEGEGEEDLDEEAKRTLAIQKKSDIILHIIKTIVSFLLNLFIPLRRGRW